MPDAGTASVTVCARFRPENDIERAQAGQRAVTFSEVAAWGFVRLSSTRSFSGGESFSSHSFFSTCPSSVGTPSENLAHALLWRKLSANKGFNLKAHCYHLNN